MSKKMVPGNLITGKPNRPEGVSNMKKLPVIELFGPTIQGEGALAGTVSHFVRLGGCGYRCSWCDSMHAVDPKQVKANRTMMSAQEIHDDLYARAGRVWVTLSGGDPVMHDCEELVQALAASDFQVAVETQGQLFKDWLSLCHHVTLSPKPPSSGEADKLDYAILDKYMALREENMKEIGTENFTSVCLKIVVFNQDDYAFARMLHRRYPDVTMYLSVGTEVLSQNQNELILKAYRALAETVCADPEMHDTMVLPQLHVLMWGQEKGR
jgi:7-carboxy-7-deazaguanine synthase